VVLDQILGDDRSAEHGVDIMSALNATQLWAWANSPVHPRLFLCGMRFVWFERGFSYKSYKTRPRNGYLRLS